MYLHLALCIVDEEVEVFVLYVQHGFVVNRACESDCDIRQTFISHLRLVDIEKVAVLLNVLRSIHTKNGSAGGVKFRHVFHRETRVGCCPTHIESVYINSFHLHSGHKGQVSADGAYLKSDFQGLRCVVLAILLMVAKHEIVHVVVAHFGIHILKQHCAVHRTIWREYHSFVPFQRWQCLSGIRNVA